MHAMEFTALCLFVEDHALQKISVIQKNVRYWSQNNPKHVQFHALKPDMEIHWHVTKICTVGMQLIIIFITDKLLII